MPVVLQQMSATDEVANKIKRVMEYLEGRILTNQEALASFRVRAKSLLAADLKSQLKEIESKSLPTHSDLNLEE